MKNLAVKPYSVNFRNRGLLKASYSNSAEQWASNCLKASGIKFTRQAYLYGRYVDFWSKKHGLIIEIDGYTHLDENQL